jgi:predicted RNA-binding Zn ribbon-like protein
MPREAAGSPAGRMKLVGGDPAIDFVNTVGGRVSAGAGRTRVRGDKLASYSDLVAFAVHRGLVDDALGRELLRRGGARPREARRALARALGFREALHRTVRALAEAKRPAAADLEVVNAEVLDARSRESLASRGGRVGWEWREPAAALESPLWPVARAAAALLASDETRRVRECDGEGCGWLFLDRSRGRRRRWCTMEDCGNLAKVRRFRRRRAAGR